MFQQQFNRQSIIYSLQSEAVKEVEHILSGRTRNLVGFRKVTSRKDAYVVQFYYQSRDGTTLSRIAHSILRTYLEHTIHEWSYSERLTDTKIMMPRFDMGADVKIYLTKDIGYLPDQNGNRRLRLKPYQLKLTQS